MNREPDISMRQLRGRSNASIERERAELIAENAVLRKRLAEWDENERLCAAPKAFAAKAGS
jgi:hypothetical protein